MAAGELSSVNRSKTGFTLIELLIVSGLTTMLLLTVTAMFMTFLTSSTNTSIRRVLNREGTYALNQIEFLLRNARSVVCNPGNSIEVISIDDRVSTLSYDGAAPTTRIASASATTTTYLTSTAVGVSGGSFSCDNVGDKTFVNVAFNLQKLNSVGQTIGQPEAFTTNVQVRN